MIKPARTDKTCLKFDQPCPEFLLPLPRSFLPLPECLLPQLVTVVLPKSDRMEDLPDEGHISLPGFSLGSLELGSSPFLLLMEVSRLLFAGRSVPETA